MRSKQCLITQAFQLARGPRAVEGPTLEAVAGAGLRGSRATNNYQGPRNRLMQQPNRLRQIMPTESSLVNAQFASNRQNLSTT
jgi:hypothetical protein